MPWRTSREEGPGTYESLARSPERSDRVRRPLPGRGLRRKLFRSGFPWGTFIVNVSGSFLIGVVLSFVGGGLLPAGARPFLAVGVLGGYTTFSTYTHETLQLIQDGELGAAAFNTLGQVVAGLIAVYLVVLSRAL